jgi:folate-dependent phosphoribosylglycinamide formyltransferase PurN
MPLNESDHNLRVTLLARRGPLTNILFHALTKDFNDVTVILEQPISRSHLVLKRIKRCGLVTVAGQALFLIAAEPLLKRAGAKRIDSIKVQYGMDDSPLPDSAAEVGSVNSAEAKALLERRKPDIVIVYGTRIISKKLFGAFEVPFVNIHSGITPSFRGVVQGGYWALAKGRPDLAGTTIHFIDAGVDTGCILKQVTFKVSREDSYATYPYLHLAHALPLLMEAIREILEGRPEIRQIASDLPSKLYYHPTLWGYLGRRYWRGVR